MTDEKFIYDFLDNGYKVTIGSSDYLFVKQNLENFKEYLERWKKECHNIEECKEEIETNINKGELK